MHILHVHLGKSHRSSWRQTELLISELAREPDICQSLVCHIDSPLRDSLASLPVRIVPVCSRLGGHGIAADIVHAHEAWAVRWTSVHALLRRTPYVLTRRESAPMQDTWKNRLVYGRAACITALTSPIAKELETWLGKEVVCIPGCSARLQENFRKTQKIWEQFAGKILVGHIGALVDRVKGQSLILDAARRLRTSYPELHFLFWGDGEDRDFLCQRSEDLENVSWMGFEPDIGPCIAALDLFVFPSHSEGRGSILLDVMDFGVPVIASKLGGIPDIIVHNVNGELLSSLNSEELEKAIIRLYTDKDLARKYVRAGRERVKNFTPQITAVRYLKVYHRVYAGRS